MTTVGGFFKTFREAILISDRVERLTENCKALAVDVKDHERRLVRMETLVEVAQGRAAAPRLNDDR